MCVECSYAFMQRILPKDSWPILPRFGKSGSRPYTPWRHFSQEATVRFKEEYEVILANRLIQWNSLQVDGGYPAPR